MVRVSACRTGSSVLASPPSPSGWLRWGTVVLAALAVVVSLSAGKWAWAGAPGGAPVAPAGFDRQAVEAELASPLRSEPPDAMQARLSRLVEAHASLDRAELAPEERKAQGERILFRIAELRLLLRPRPQATPAPRWSSAVDGLGSTTAGLVTEGPAILLLVLGGLVICFALGSLAGYRRGARHASYYGEGDPRIRFVVRSHTDPRIPPHRVTLEQIRRRLREGNPVLLQLGYEIVPAQRVRFLAAVTNMQESLRAMEGQALTVWEDPRHANRFYECLECRDLAALDRLTALDGPLPELASEVEACRAPDGWIVRRAWWGIGQRTGRTQAISPGAARPGG